MIAARSSRPQENLIASLHRQSGPNLKGTNVISQLAGHRVSGREVEYGGLPGHEYVINVKRP